MEIILAFGLGIVLVSTIVLVYVVLKSNKKVNELSHLERSIEDIYRTRDEQNGNIHRELDKINGKITPLNIPNIIVNVTDTGKLEKTPPLDLVSRMSQLAVDLQQGKLDNIFVQIDNFNQYDPTQDYLKQIEFAANYYLENEPNNLNWRYTLVLSQLLQRKAPELIQNLTELTKYDRQNPYTWLYLAFVYLYDFQPKQAEKQLIIAEKLKPDIPELKTLKTVTNIMKFLPLIHL